MKHPNPFVLGYCTNVHPGSNWLQVYDNLKNYTLAVRGSLKSELARAFFGAGIWLSDQAAKDLLQNENLERFKSFLNKNQLRIFSFNGFPFGNFHDPLVKHQVYRPDWSQPERLNYTLNLFKIAQKIALPGSEFTISTVPISYQKVKDSSPDDFSMIVNQLVKAAIESVRIEKETEIQISLCLEPEPLCTLQKSSDVAWFFQTYLLPYGSQLIKKSLGVTEELANEILLNKIKICYDTCHAAVCFENPITVLSSYHSLGIQIGKIQISSAPTLQLIDGKLKNGLSPSQAIGNLANDKYLHQVIGKTSSGNFTHWDDLPLAIQDWEKNRTSGEFRIHYHVPIHQAEFENLSTTQSHILQLIELNSYSPICSQWEVETYTWNSILSLGNQSQNLCDLIAKEINWAMNSLQSRGYSSP